MGTSATRAKNKFNRERYDQYLLTMAKGDKKRYKAIADGKGMSMNAYIIQAIEEKIQRDNN